MISRTAAAPTVGTTLDTVDLALVPLKGNFFISDITTQVKAWLTTPVSEFGIAITSDGVATATLASKEGAASGHPAYIEVDVNDGSGIGSTGSTALFDIAGTAAGGEHLRLSGQEFSSLANSSTDGISLLLGVNRNNNHQLWIGNSDQLAVSTDNPVIRISPQTSTASASFIDCVATDGSTPLPLKLGNNGINIDATGAVGFGTAKPGSLVDIASSTVGKEHLRLSGQEFNTDGNSDTNGISFLLGINRDGGPANNNRQLWIANSSVLDVNDINPVIRIAPTDTAAGCFIDAIATDGATSLPLKLGNNGIVISSNGDVGIGRTASGFKLDVNGSLRCFGAVNTSSDARYKTDVHPVTGALETIGALRGVSYEWNHAAFPEKSFPQRRSLGFIAQEVEKVLPDLVTKDAEGYYSVSYSEVIPVLVEATKELRAENAALKAANLALAEKMADFDRQLADLKAERGGGPARTVHASLDLK